MKKVCSQSCPSFDTCCRNKNKVSIDDVRAINKAINSLKYNPDIKDSLELRTLEDRLVAIRDNLEVSNE